MPKEEKYAPQNVRTPSLPTTPTAEEFSEGVPDSIFGSDVANPEAPLTDFDPKVQHGVRELQVGGGGGEGFNAVWMTAKHGLLYPSVTVIGTTALFTNEHVIFVDASAGAIAIGLPIGQGGKEYVIKKIDSTANSVTIVSTVSQNIDGASTLLLSAQYDTIRIVFDTVDEQWYIAGSY